MPNEQEVRTKLNEMAKLAMFSGRISSVHEQNLLKFPFIFFNDVESVKIDYDLDVEKDKTKMTNGPKGQIIYYIGLNEEKNQNNTIKRLKSLEIAIKELFWSDLEIKIYFNDRKVYPA